MVSDDGRTWSKLVSNLPTGGQITDFAANDTTAVAMVDGNLYSSTDLVSWSPVQGTDGRQVHGVEFASNIFVAVRTYVSGELFSWITSTDGVTWTEREGLEGGIYLSKADSLYSANGRFFLGSTVSLDGITWNRDVSGLPEGDSVAFYKGQYVSISGKNSNDGITWEGAFNLGESFNSPNRMIVHDGSLVRARSGTNGDYIVSSESAVEFPPIPAKGISPSIFHRVFNGKLWGRFSTVSNDGLNWEYPKLAAAGNGREISPILVDADGSDYWVLGHFSDIYSGNRSLFRGSHLSLLSKVSLPGDASYHDINEMSVLKGIRQHEVYL